MKNKTSKIKNISILLFSILVSFSAWSIETKRPAPVQKTVVKIQNERFYLMNYQEGENFHIDIFKMGANGFQERIFRQDFEKVESANAKYSELVTQYRKRPHAKIDKSNEIPRAQYRSFKLWTVTQEWDETWEDRYTEWMSANLTTDFFYNKNIPTDCADVPVTYRWIFAFLNGLPAGNKLSGSGRLFTQDSAPTSWQNLPTHENWWENQRFLKAIEYLHDNTFTGSVFYDLYPVAITPRAVSAGAVWLINSYHTYNVGQSDQQASEWLKWYSSTVPRKIRKLYLGSFSGSQPTYDYNGFQRPRWVKKVNNVWTMVAPESMPWYSLEQYDSSFVTDPEQFEEKVYERLFSAQLPPEQKYSNYVNALYSQFDWRVYVVEDGYNYCFPNGCPEGSASYENYSTPSRDSRILSLILKIENLLTEHNIPELHADWSYVLNNYYLRITSDSESRYIYYHELIRIWKSQLYSSDPNQSILVRWGQVRENPDMQSEEEIQEASERIQSLFPTVLEAESLGSQKKSQILANYNHIDPNKLIPEKLKTDALAFFELNKKGFTNKSYISIVDFSRYSDKARYYLVNMSTGEVERIYTSHGQGSDTNNDGLAERFSNIVDSRMSSLGAVRTGEVYSGSFGRSMRLDGLVDTNSNIRRRAIVMHGSDYVHQEPKKQGRSYGCLALDWDIKDDLITKIKDGSLIYVGLSTSR